MWRCGKTRQRFLREMWSRTEKELIYETRTEKAANNKQIYDCLLLALFSFFIGLTFQRGFCGCFDNFHGTVITAIKRADEIFYFGIFGRLLGVED